MVSVSQPLSKYDSWGKNTSIICVLARNAKLDASLLSIESATLG